LFYVRKKDHKTKGKKVKSERIEVALFDLGGVLVELTGVSTLMSWTGGRMGPEEIWRRWLTSPSVRAFETGAMEPEDFADVLIAELDLTVQRAEFLDAFTYWPRGLFPGAMQLVSEIPRPIIRATLSNSNSLHWPRLMTEMGLSEAFDFHFASHLMEKIKGQLETKLLEIGKNSFHPFELAILGEVCLRAEQAEEGLRALMD
jgi:putative hydrolase of the HAD superfamily